jgi:putative DNA primase/helicase
MRIQYYVPEHLKNMSNWILWKKEKDNKGRMTKIPYSANYNGKAQSNNSYTWCNYNKAKFIYDSSPGKYDGIGIVLSKKDNIVFIDIDHCFEDGNISKQADDIIKLFPKSYIELSQSGEGIHILTIGTIPRCFKNSKKGIEMYNDKRFVAFTGQAVNPIEPNKEQESIDAIFDKYATKKAEYSQYEVIRHDVTLSERDILRKACANKINGDKFTDLYCGNWQQHFNSQSEADQSLCNMLAFWCNRDINVMDNIFRSSGLMRDKWNRTSYRTTTLTKAIFSCIKDFAEYLDGKLEERKM